MKFKDEIVVITGATRGIGKTIAAAFAKEISYELFHCDYVRQCTFFATNLLYK